MANEYQKAKDVFIQRKTNHGTFEEYALIVNPSSVVITDCCDNLIMVSTASLLVDSASHAVQSDSASYLSGSKGIVETFTVTGLLNAGQISSSQVYITSSHLIVTSNIIEINAQVPHERYAGIAMYDSGSTQQEASLLWDGQNNYFFVSSSDGGYDRQLITGPENEGFLTLGYIPVATGSNGLIDSIISQSGNSIVINGDLVTNNITASQFLGTASNAVSSSYALSSSYSYSGSYAESASYALSSSYAVTSSFVTFDNYFLKNTTTLTESIIRQYDSIFNPSNLFISSSHIFIIRQNADYYVLGDLINSGTIINDGTLKIGGILYNVGFISGSGIIE